MDYPSHLLARPAAPPYVGEGPHRLWHFSEDPDLDVFHPRPPASDPEAQALVWAVDIVLWAYELPADTFAAHEVGGYWVSDQSVSAVDRVAVTDVVARHAEAGIELRVTPSLWPWWLQVIERSTIEFSGSRLRNAVPGPVA